MHEKRIRNIFLTMSERCAMISHGRLGLTSILLGTVLLLVVANSCGPKEPPTEASARKLFENLLRQDIDKGVIRVKSFTKLDGSNFNDEVYILNYKAEIECLKDFRVLSIGQVTCSDVAVGAAGEVIVVETHRGRSKVTFGAVHLANSDVTQTSQDGVGRTLILRYAKGNEGYRVVECDIEMGLNEPLQPGLRFYKTRKGWKGEDGNLY